MKWTAGAGDVLHNFPTASLVSDIHLEVDKPDLLQILLQYLRSCAGTYPAVFLLGDIFEAWVGDDDASPLIDDVIYGLNQLSRSGTNVFLMHGNRDFLLGPAFADRAAVTLIQDPSVFGLGGVATLLTHGDRYCTEEVEYQAFRKQSREPAWQAAVLSKSLPERRALARSMRNQSVEAQRAAFQSRGSYSDVVADDVIRDALSAGVQRVIHGHTHRPDRHLHTLPNGGQLERIVLADWNVAGEAVDIHHDGSITRRMLALA